MSALVIVARYRAITGDAAGSDPAVSAAIEDAIDRLEERIDRPVREAIRSESMFPDQWGRVYPHAIPISLAAGYTIDGYSLIGTFPWPWIDIVGLQVPPSITYTGGWVERAANPNAANRLPSHFEDDIAWAAYQLLHPTAADDSAIPVGAMSVSNGDVSISFGPGGAPGPNRTSIRWSRQTLAYKYTRIAGA